MATPIRTYGSGRIPGRRRRILQRRALITLTILLSGLLELGPVTNRVQANVDMLHADSHATTTSYCPLKETPTLKLLEMAKNKNFYECPGDLPREFTECCDNNRCCTMSIYKQFDQSLSFLVAIFIFSVSFVFSIILFLCCFCPPCPLYNSCKTKYTRDYAGCAHKMGESPLFQTMMPNDDSPNGLILANGETSSETMMISKQQSNDQPQHHYHHTHQLQAQQAKQINQSAQTNGLRDSALNGKLSHLHYNLHFEQIPHNGTSASTTSTTAGSSTSSSVSLMGTFQPSQPQISNSVVKLSGFRHHHHHFNGNDYEFGGHIPEEVV